MNAKINVKLIATTKVCLSKVNYNNELPYLEGDDVN